MSKSTPIATPGQWAGPNGRSPSRSARRSRIGCPEDADESDNGSGFVELDLDDDDDEDGDGSRGAARLTALARRLYHAGRFEEAMTAAQEAIGIYRRLAGIQPQAFLPQLTRSLTDLAMVGSRLSWTLALAPAEEATAIYRKLAESDPLVLPDVASSLSGLLTYLSEMSSCVTGQNHDGEKTNEPAPV